MNMPTLHQPKIFTKLARKLASHEWAKTVYCCIYDYESGMWFGVVGDGDNGIYETYSLDAHGTLTVSSSGYGDVAAALKAVMAELFGGAK